MIWSHLTETTMLQWRFRVPGKCHDWTARCWSCQSYGPMHREYNWNHPQKRLASHSDYIDLQIRNTKMSQTNKRLWKKHHAVFFATPTFGSRWMMLTLEGSMETNFLVLIWFRFVKFLLNPNWKHLQFVKQFSPTFSMDQAESETAFLLICNTGFGARLRQVLEVADTGFRNLGILNLFRFQNYQEVHLCLAGVNIQKKLRS